MYHFDDIASFRERNKSKSFLIPIDQVKLVERIHKKKPDQTFGGGSEPLILVRKTQDGWALVTGWRDYWRAVQSNAQRISAVRVYSRSRHDFIDAFKRRINVKEVIIPDCFRDNPPKANKVKNVIRYYKRNGVFDKPIILGKGNILKDGYARYCAAVTLGVTEIPYIR